MFGLFGDAALKKQRTRYKEVHAKLVDMEKRADMSGLAESFSEVWEEHPEQQEFEANLATARQLIDLLDIRLKMAKERLPEFDEPLETANQLLDECQTYLENLVVTLIMRQSLLKSSNPDVAA